MTEKAEKSCAQCGESISAEARLCKHCHSYQDWRGHLTLSNSVLALLVALVSVLSFALPNIVELFRTHDSKVELSHPVVRGTEIYLMATNTGTRPGIISSAVIQGALDGTAAEVKPVSPNDSFVRPGSQQVAFKIDMKLSGLEAAMRALKAIDAPLSTLTFTVEQASGAKSDEQFVLNGPQLFGILYSHAERCDQVGSKASLANGCKGLTELQQESDEAHQQLQRKLRDAVEN